MTLHRGHTGFTLIEVTVAMAILALSLGVLYESFGWGIRRSAVTLKRERALLACQSLLSEVRAHPLVPGDTNGILDGSLSWNVHVAPHDDTVPEEPWVALDVTVEAKWGQRAAEIVRLQSIELTQR